MKNFRSGFSLRSLSKQAEIANGYLPMVLAGKRNLSSKAWAKLVPLLGATQSERSYLNSLHALGQTDSQIVQLDAVDKLQRFRAYQTLNPKETETYRYLTHWYYVAIREMVGLSDFRPDPKWIQTRLRIQVPLHEIKRALDFLVKNGFLTLEKDGSLKQSQKSIECVGGVYRIALGKFHREMLALGAKSIENTSSQRRNITGHTFAIAEKQYEEAKKILSEALERIEKLGSEAASGDSVYHVVFACFPLTRSEGDGA